MKKFGLLLLPLAFSALSFAPAQKNSRIVPNRTAGIQANVKKIEAQNWTVYQQDIRPLTNMCDGNRETISWLYNPNNNGTSYLEIEFYNSVVLDDLYIYFSESSTDWLTSGTFYYSDGTLNDNSELIYTLIDSFTITSKQDVYIRAYGYEAKFIKFVGNTSYNNSWVQISEIGYNSGHFASDLIESIEVSWASGMESNTSLNYMLDDSDETFTRMHRPDENEYIVLKLREATAINSVRFKFYDDENHDHFNYGELTYSLDNTTYSNFNDPSAYIDGTFIAQYLDIRDNPVSAQYIKLTVTYPAGWVNIADFSINTIGNLSKYTFNGPTKMYGGTAIVDMFDGRVDTHAWFEGRVSSIEVDFFDIYCIDSIELRTGQVNDAGDSLSGEISYSVDGSTWTKLADYSGQNLQVFNGNGAQARYLKLTNEIYSFSAIRIFNINKSPTKYVSQNGLVGLNNNNDLGLLVDGKLDFAYWVDWHFESNSYVQVEYTEPVEANNIVFLQQGYVIWPGVSSTADTFSKSKLEWSLDGSIWTKVGDYTGQTNILYSFDTPTTLKFIRMTYTGEEASGTGFAVREFDINFVKHSIDASFISNPSFSDAEYKGYERLPYESGLNVSYKNLRTGAESSSIPTEISKYEVTLSSAGNDVYNAVNITTTMTVEDSATNLKADFEALLDNGSICSALNTDEMDEILYRYDNCLSADELDALASLEFENSDGDQMSVVTALEYAKTKLEASKNSLNSVLAKNDSNNVISIVAIIIISLVLIGSAFFYIRNKKIKE